MSSGSTSARKTRKRKTSQKGTRKDSLTSEEISFLAGRIRTSFDQFVMTLGLESHKIDDARCDHNNKSNEWKPAVVEQAFNNMGKTSSVLTLLETALVETNNRIVWDEFKEKFNVECQDKRHKGSELAIGPNKCAVAGVKNQFKHSSLMSVAIVPMQDKVFCKKQFRLGIITKSTLIKYDEDEDDVRMSCLLHDGQTIWKAVAFAESARKWQNILKEGNEYGLKDFTIRRTDERYECTEFLINLHLETVCDVFPDTELNVPKEKKYKLTDIKDETFEKMLISTDAVIICYIGTCFQPKQKFLREMYVMDTKGIMMKVNFWSDCDKDFEFNFEDTIKLKYVRLDQFDDEYHLEFTEVSKIIKCTADKRLFRPFLLNSTIHLQTINMSLEEINDLEESRYNVIVNEAVIKRFKRDDHIYKQCVVKNHGKMDPLSDGTFYCERCKKSYKVGKDVVKLVASIDDGSSQAWVMMYTQNVEVLLGKKFDVFMEDDTKRSERSEMLDEIKTRKRKYKFVLKVICRNDESGQKEQRIIVQNVCKLH